MKRTVSALLLVLACRGPNYVGEGGSGPTSSGAEGPCASSAECPDGQVCVAPYEGKGGPGEFACVAECLGADVEESWCADDKACCSGLTCDTMGYCRDTHAETESGTAETSGGAETTGSGSETTGETTGETTATDTGSGDATDTGSDTSGTSSTT